LLSNARRGSEAAGAALRRDVPSDTIHFDLAYQPPYDWSKVLAFLGVRAVTGVEVVKGDTYLRTVRVGRRRGWLAVRPGRGSALSVELSASLAAVASVVIPKVRRVFDLDARSDLIDAHLARDPRLAPHVRKRPGLRVPGAFEPFETAIAAVIGQQVTVRAAVTVTGRLVYALGEEVVTPFETLHRAWPTAADVAKSNVSQIARLGMPGARARAILGLAEAIASGRLQLEAPTSPVTLETQLRALPGIGSWTAQYILMRASSWPDAFPEKDVALAKALGAHRDTVRYACAEPWRPWRSYATLHLWTSLSG
jgi:AraC family transcriptional regulator of adaptative response / DNA-3-methyladenine glycosylase II